VQRWLTFRRVNVQGLEVLEGVDGMVGGACGSAVS